MEVKEIVLPVEVANGILGYLATRPYQEVANLIKAVEQTARLMDGSPVSIGQVPPAEETPAEEAPAEEN